MGDGAVILNAHSNEPPFEIEQTDLLGIIVTGAKLGFGRHRSLDPLHMHQFDRGIDNDFELKSIAVHIPHTKDTSGPMVPWSRTSPPLLQKVL
jgi:hypothetical protein